MGFQACENAGKVPFVGQHGAGKGATVGKIRGLKYASKSGVGAFSVKVAGATVTAIVAVNALGDVFDGEAGRIVAGAKANDGTFLDTERQHSHGRADETLHGHKHDDRLHPHRRQAGQGGRKQTRLGVPRRARPRDSVPCTRTSTATRCSAWLPGTVPSSTSCCCRPLRHMPRSVPR